MEDKDLALYRIWNVVNRQHPDAMDNTEKVETIQDILNDLDRATLNQFDWWAYGGLE